MIPLGGFTTPGNAVGRLVGASDPVEGSGLDIVGSRRMLDGTYCAVKLSVPVGVIV
jgi:hypothetical protein